jgi:hypothetical protein
MLKIGRRVVWWVCRLPLLAVIRFEMGRLTGHDERDGESSWTSGVSIWTYVVQLLFERTR